MMQCAVLLVAVNINGEEDESNGCRDEWNGTQHGIIISIAEFQYIAFDVLDNCHCCTLFICVNMLKFEFRGKKESYK